MIFIYISGLQGGESFFREVLASMEAVYLSRNPTAKAVLELVGSVADDQICYDHFAFRTFGVISLFLQLIPNSVDFYFHY